MDNNSTQKFADKSQTYELVQAFERSEEIAQQIIEASRSGEPVIGVDCEGILRGRPLCLIQVSLFQIRPISNKLYRFSSKIAHTCLTS